MFANVLAGAPLMLKDESVRTKVEPAEALTVLFVPPPPATTYWPPGNVQVLLFALPVSVPPPAEPMILSTSASGRDKVRLPGRGCRPVLERSTLTCVVNREKSSEIPLP